MILSLFDRIPSMTWAVLMIVTPIVLIVLTRPGSGRSGSWIYLTLVPILLFAVALIREKRRGLAEAAKTLGFPLTASFRGISGSQDGVTFRAVSMPDHSYRLILEMAMPEHAELSLWVGGKDDLIGPVTAWFLRRSRLAVPGWGYLRAYGRPSNLATALLLRWKGLLPDGKWHYPMVLKNGLLEVAVEKFSVDADGALLARKLMAELAALREAVKGA